jgi:hypothetical protein
MKVVSLLKTIHLYNLYKNWITIHGYWYNAIMIIHLNMIIIKMTLGNML